WLWLVGPVMVTAFLVILFARPDAERAGNQTPPTAPQEETDSARIVVPDLRGLSYAEALSRLQEEGLLLARRVEAQGDPGVVVATDPSLGHLVSTGTRVTIFVGAAQTTSDEEATASV
ncbi:MAG: PASTA domain-containing protein, partial [Actinomycetota bacterium]